MYMASPVHPLGGPHAMGRVGHCPAGRSSRSSLDFRARFSKFHDFRTNHRRKYERPRPLPGKRGRPSQCVGRSVVTEADANGLCPRYAFSTGREKKPIFQIAAPPHGLPIGPRVRPTLWWSDGGLFPTCRDWARGECRTEACPYWHYRVAGKERVKKNQICMDYLAPTRPPRNRGVTGGIPRSPPCTLSHPAVLLNVLRRGGGLLSPKIRSKG